MNKWVNSNGQTVISETYPDDNSFPVVNLKRVSGSTYRPYVKGSATWIKAANRDLASAAQDNASGRR